MSHILSQPIFISHNEIDQEAAAVLRTELEKLGMSVVKEPKVTPQDNWLTTLSAQLKYCSSFILLVGHEGIQQWQTIEMQLALARNSLPSEEPLWLPIYVLLLPDANDKALPPILSAFPPIRWQIDSGLSKLLLTAIRLRSELRHTEKQVDGCPFLGLDTFQREHAPLFFGRRKEILDIVRYFGTQSQVHPDRIQREGEHYCRWLQIEGGSVVGKSSLINAGLVPMVEQGALWPRTGFKEWKILGPMIPSETPLQQLAELLETALVDLDERDINLCHKQLLLDDAALHKRLNAVNKPNVGFMLIVDQFEELFTVSQKNEQRRFDAQLATALLEKDSRFFLMTSVSIGFLEGFEHLLYLSECYNTRCKRYNLTAVSLNALRDIIERPAELAGVDVKEVAPVILNDAQNETGILPLVENTLHYLWIQRYDNKLSAPLYKQKGGIAGLLEHQADDLLDRLEEEMSDGKADALKLLLALTRISPDGRHTRQRISLDEARNIAGQGDIQRGQTIIDFLSGKADSTSGMQKNKSGLRLISIQGDSESPANYQLPLHKHQFVELLYEPLIRARSQDEETGEMFGYWDTLYEYISASSYIGGHQQYLMQRARTWSHSRGLWRWRHLAGWFELQTYRKLGIRSKKHSLEGDFIYWSKVALGIKTTLLTLIGLFVGESFYWTQKHGLPLDYMLMQQRFRLISLGVIPKPLPDMILLESDEPKMIVESAVTFDEDGEPIVQEPKFAKPGTEVGLAKRFYLSKYEITYEQYDYYVWENNGKVKYPATAKGGRNQLPVVNVSWYDANAYLAWLSEKTHKQYRLPTEAEWLYADRAKTTTDYWWGDGIGKNKANCIDCGSLWGGEQAAPIGSFAPNPFGLYDTVGNVHEWTCSAWREVPDGNQYACSPETSELRVFMGGSWRNRSIFLLYSSRDWDVPGYSSDNLGFRAASVE